MQKPLKRKTNGTRKPRRSPDTLTIQHILVPMDFSGYARQALTCAVPLARKHRAKISLVHVAQSPVAMRTTPDGGLVMPVNTARLVSVAKTHLDNLAATLLPDDVRGAAIVREGHAGFGVVAAADALEADLVVLSTRGRSGLSRVAFGSTAECIVRHAHCPVLTVRRKMDPAAKRLLALRQPLYPKQMPWRRILVPLDFSLTSLRALKVAVPLAQQYGARLQLLNVVEPHPYPVGMEGAVLVIPERTLAKAARRQLLRIARKFIPRSVRTTCLVAQGRAASLIVETAEAERADMIVLGTHGRTGFAWSLMGSTAERVVRHAKCPVFVVRNPRTRRTAANALRN